METITPSILGTQFNELPSEKIQVDSSTFHVNIIRDSLIYIEEFEGGIKTYPAIFALGGKNVYYFLTPFDRGRLQVLPLAYDINRKEWYNNPKSALRGFTTEEDEILPWRHIGFTFNTSCYSCHVSQLQNNYNLSSNTYHTTWKENGINCETCHGPSMEHIRVCLEAGEGKVPQDLKIIRTSLFEPEQHNSSCGSCHAKMRPITSSYMPGDRFFDHYDLTTLENPDFYPDGRDLGENYTYTTWLQSRCVTEGDLDCIHCHTSSGRYRFAKNDPYNACMPCHEDKIDQIEAHSFHPADSGIVTCVSCHMPMTEFARMHRSDHSMRPPAPLASMKFGSPNACIICHDDKTNEWAQEFMVKWGKADFQQKILDEGNLILEARNENWVHLDQMLNKLDNREFDLVFSASILRLLRTCSDDKKWPSILKATNHPSPLVRSAAATTLADLHNRESMAALLRLCEDDYRLVRVAAAQSITYFPESLFEGSENTGYFAALNEYIESITARPDDWSSHATLGNFYFNRQDYDKAIRHYEYSTDLFPENVGAYVNCGFVYTMKGDLDQAEAQFRKALDYEPLNEGANLNYALLLGEMGRMDEAEAVFKKLLEINPESAVAAYNLSVISSKKNMEEAIRFAELAVKNDPMNPKYSYTLGYFLYQQQRFGRAERVLSDLIDSISSYGDAYLLLYEIYVRTGQAENARRLSERASANQELHESYRMRFSQLIKDPS
jgi:tetratricopeptide (TPR) repeat protein